MRRALAALPAAVAAAAMLPGSALAAEGRAFLLSATPSGGFPNGPSRAPAFSQDRQLAGRAAFESDASDLVPDDANGAVTDVFVTERANWRSDGLRGLRWRPGATRLVSRAPGGQPANGRSFAPDLDGDQLHDGLQGRPRGHCVAFLSEATNLVPGDTNGRPDAFVADLRTGAVTRVSLDALGRQARGATYDVQIDGACERVAFTSDAPNLALTKATWKRLRRPRALRPFVTVAPPPGQRQVYVRDLRPGGPTFLASANGTAPGNGPSYDVSLAKGDGCPVRCDGADGFALAFTSEAANLSPRDADGLPAVYRRLDRRIAGRWTGSLEAAVHGDAPSGQPAIASRGGNVAFTTSADDVLACTRLLAGTVCDGNGVSDVGMIDLTGRRPRTFWVSASTAIGQPGNGASGDPAITRYGSVAFTSAASNLQPTPFGNRGPDDRNGAPDVFYWSEQHRRVSLFSDDSEDLPRPAAIAATQPAISAYNNYLAYVTADPRVDLTRPPGPGTEQVYLRYVGPR